MNRVTLLGENHTGGVYVLRIQLAEGMPLRFGRFKGGKLINLCPGDYVYVGSALSVNSAPSLARRLIRHATRSGDKPPHAIRGELLTYFDAPGQSKSSLLLKRPKRLHWNVDHLLDLPIADLTHILAIRTSTKQEGELGRFLMKDPHTIIFEERLGANDFPGNTHLLRVEADEAWWANLADRLERHFVV